MKLINIWTVYQGGDDQRTSQEKAHRRRKESLGTMNNYIAWVVKFDDNIVVILLQSDSTFNEAIQTAQKLIPTAYSSMSVLSNVLVQGPETTLPRNAIFYNALPEINSSGNVTIAHLKFSLFDNPVVVKRKNDNDFTVFS